MQKGHNLRYRQFHPKGLCLLPSMYRVTVTPTQVQHQQLSLKQCFNGCHKATSDQEVIRTKQSKNLSLGTISGTIKIKSTSLIPRGYNPSRSIPRTGPLGKIRTRKPSINQSSYFNPGSETIIHLGHMQTTKPGLPCLKGGQCYPTNNLQSSRYCGLFCYHLSTG